MTNDDDPAKAEQEAQEASAKELLGQLSDIHRMTTRKLVDRLKNDPKPLSASELKAIHEFLLANGVSIDSLYQTAQAEETQALLDDLTVPFPTNPDDPDVIPPFN
ncbi:hypothetical protein [Thiohalobacter thiocyanaticus]|uniref:Uncharacterized protein n=1 Tax=Thiohalobacter thiocyanaticus TaxID=585455 RepID=A0A426QJH2_9GAMM|nr:hypothetical protein [Thiohalobacter thiocyanaticus]RRQ21914.1 hypothetical protein D6C00_08110 [Thiohalobacter thiocyanaticus]